MLSRRRRIRPWYVWAALPPSSQLQLRQVPLLRPRPCSSPVSWWLGCALAAVRSSRGLRHSKGLMKARLMSRMRTKSPRRPVERWQTPSKYRSVALPAPHVRPRERAPCRPDSDDRQGWVRRSLGNASPAGRSGLEPSRVAGTVQGFLPSVAPQPRSRSDRNSAQCSAAPFHIPRSAQNPLYKLHRKDSAKPICSISGGFGSITRSAR